MEPAAGPERSVGAASVACTDDKSGGRDAELARAAADVDNIVSLHRRYGKQIFAFCFRELRSREDAEDATQLTFLNAFRWGLKKQNRIVNPAILFTIARNVCLNSKRSSFRRQRVEIATNVEENATAIPALESDSDAVLRLPDALRALPTHQRHAILLREWQGLSYQEIGVELGLSQSAIEGLVFRARRTLAGLLNEGLGSRSSDGRESAITGDVADSSG